MPICWGQVSTSTLNLWLLDCVLITDRAQVQQSMKDGTPLVMQAILSTISQAPGSGPPTNQYVSALTCFQAWLCFLPAECVLNVRS